jgi:hypothetical protein
MQGDPQPFGYGPYAPPEATGSRPAVITWYRVYASMMVMLYVGFLVLWLFLTPSSGTGTGAANPEVVISLLIVLGVVLLFGGFHAVAALVPYKPWGWTVGLVAICIGLTSCTAVAAVPLLIFWLKPETKAAFCRL